MDFKIGDNVQVYDPRIWNQTRKDIRDNSHCWKDAVILQIRENVYSSLLNWNYPILIDVLFLYDRHISIGHFPESIR